MTEKPFFLSRGDSRLFAIAHVPDESPRPTAYVMSHPFGEEKLWSHRAMVSFARALAVRGHVVLRFDYSGAGDSSGDTATADLATHQTDLLAAIEAVQTHHPELARIGLIGLRLGATVAALTLEQVQAGRDAARLRSAPLILWDPILDGDTYFQELLRTNLSTQLAFYGKVRENREVLTERIRNGGTVNVDGYELGKGLLDSYGRQNLLGAATKRHQGPTLVAQISATSSQKDREDLHDLASSYDKGTFARATEQPFWREIRKFYGQANDLQSMTLNWLSQIDD